MIRPFAKISVTIGGSFALVAALISSPNLAAAAPTRSFVAAKDGLAADIEILASANLKIARSTQLFSVVTSAIAKEAEVKDGLALVKKSCGIDVVNAIDDLTVGVDANDKGAVYVALTGVTEDQFTKCASTLAKAKTGETLTVKKTGNVTELTRGSDKLYFGWLANNVLVVAGDPDDERLLKKQMGGGLAKATKMNARIAKVDTDAAAFAAWTREQAIQTVTEHGGTASIGYVSGYFTLKLAIDLGDAKEAEKLVRGANAALNVLVPKNAPKEAQKIVSSIQLKASGSEVDLALQAAEADLQKIVSWAMTH